MQLVTLVRIAQRDDRSTAHSSLTDREYEVALLVSAGLTNKHIADQMGIFDATVK